jgi:hypothetical protein
MGDPEDLGGGWYKYVDAEDRPYYFNTITEVTQWELPENLDDYLEDDQQYDEEHVEDGARGEQGEVYDEDTSDAFAAMYIRDTNAEDIAQSPGLLTDHQQDQQQDQQEGSFKTPTRPAPLSDSARGVVHTAISPARGFGMPAMPAMPALARSQFEEAMQMLRSQLPEFESVQQEKKLELSGQKMGVTRFNSQYHQSLNALKSQGVDVPQPGAEPLLTRAGSNRVTMTSSKLGYGDNLRRTSQSAEPQRHQYVQPQLSELAPQQAEEWRETTQPTEVSQEGYSQRCDIYRITFACWFDSCRRIFVYGMCERGACGKR